MTINEMLTEAIDRLCVENVKAAALRDAWPDTFQTIGEVGAIVGLEYAMQPTIKVES